VASEQELLLKAKQFDTCALAEIYDLYSPRLYRYAVRLLGDTCMAEDCVADTFSQFLKALRNNNGPRDYLQAYLFRVIHNLVVDHYRGEPSPQRLNDHTPDHEHVEDNAEQNIRQQSVRSAICQLPSPQQQVILLKFVEGWENDEIARTLKKPIGAVKSLQHRALTRLQKILLDHECEHDEKRKC
jgi:RNA polymerase sigma-70 factor (ECF subfamily)